MFCLINEVDVVWLGADVVIFDVLSTWSSCIDFLFRFG